jgi:Fe-S cluster assembly iron-binding protein IscA
MLGKDYSFENSGKNLGSSPLLNFKNKVILIVDKNNNSFLENKEFLEYVNLTSNSEFMRGYHYYDVNNNEDTQELTEFNKRDMTIVFPNKGSNPENPSGAVCRGYGCQMVAMRYQLVDKMLTENDLFFDRAGYAFCLKPESLRYIPRPEKPTPIAEKPTPIAEKPTPTPIPEKL